MRRRVVAVVASCCLLEVIVVVGILVAWVEEVVLETLFLCSDRVPRVVVLLVVFGSIFGWLVGGCLAQWRLIIELLMIEDLWVLSVSVRVNCSMVNQFMECWGVMLVLFVE